MFTGLIEAIGTVTEVGPMAGGQRMTVSTKPELLTDLALGDSIAVDGVCTTVIARDGQAFTFEASPETLAKTTFGELAPGKRVNLERPLLPTTRLGGHYVTGHVDGLARLVDRTLSGDWTALTFDVESADLATYLVQKGSVTVNGISLTVNTVNGTHFGVMIIPHTLLMTNLGDVEPGGIVNIETDILGKYVRKFLAPTLSAVQPTLANDIPFIPAFP